MHPLLFNIGPVPIHTYGFLIAVGFLLAVTLSKRLAVRNGIEVERVIDLAFWCLLTGFIGARILFIITRFSYFMADPISVFKVWEGGLVFYGGPIVALPAGIWYIRRHRLPVWKTCDVIIPGLVLAHMFGRFGCLSAGCCYGKPTGTNYGIRLYSDLVDPALRGIPLHPTQLYGAGSLFILLCGLLWIFKHKKFDGQVTLTYFMAYPIIRSIIEIFRGDEIRGFVIQDWLSTSQFISIIVFILAAYASVWRLKQTRAQQGIQT